MFTVGDQRSLVIDRGDQQRVRLRQGQQARRVYQSGQLCGLGTFEHGQ